MKSWKSAFSPKVSVYFSNFSTVFSLCFAYFKYCLRRRYVKNRNTACVETFVI